ncbi:hypothetical protein [uncultured Algibacter sp.]|uniref:hypothetical protein n=1 Tax=uncultured Algibacter sp. TaxID=298659 RepID=UPI00262C849F|nr:hypothetical protein [uncultured Algibacter sp.]
MNKYIFYYLVVFLFTLQSCDNDDDVNTQTKEPISETEKDIIFQTENFGDLKNSDFLGIISDEEGNAISDVQIAIGNSVAVTDINGVFIINSASVFEKFAHIKAEKEGYIIGSRVIVPKEEGVNQIRITLLEKTVIGSVNSGESSEISLPNGSKVSFEGGFTDSNNNPYSGQVNVSMHYLEPNSRHIFSEMPGSLYAQNENNDPRNLETYGMLSVNLFSPSGEQLNIAENSLSMLEFPIADSQLNSAPDTIELWYFDEEQGYWKEDGIAVRTGNKYRAEVSHFTWWNCDIPYESVYFCFTTDLASASSHYVEIRRGLTDQFIFSGEIDFNDGLDFECGLIPLNEEIEISIYGTGACENILIDQAIYGPYSSDTSITITLPPLVDEISTTLITGNAFNCLGNPITNGYLLIDFETVVSITNGLINFSLQHCSFDTKELMIYDLDFNQFSEIITITPNGTSVDLGTKSSCNMLGGTYTGDVFLESQEQVDAFSLFGYKDIIGNLTIGLESESTNIDDISALASIETISGYIVVKNTELLNLQGVENINTISGGFWIYKNNNLLTVTEFTSLTNFSGGFHIQDNPNLVTISFSGFDTVEYLFIGFNANLTTVVLNDLVTVNDLFRYLVNPSLTSLGEFNNFTNVGGNLMVRFADQLINLQGLNNLQSVGSITIDDNQALSSLEGLDSLTEIVDEAVFFNNSQLADFQGFNSVTTIGGDLHITNNLSLSAMNGLNSLTTIGGDVLIDTNTDLTSIDGLSNLQSISGGLTISNNDQLTSLAGLSNLTSISNLEVENNDALSSLIDLNAVTNLGRLVVEDNDSLLMLSAFSNLTVLNKIAIKDNLMLTSIQGFENITTIADYFTLDNNPLVTSIQPLSNVSGQVDVILIRNNDSLTDLTGLENITSVGTGVGDILYIWNNDGLVSINGLQGIDRANVANNINLTDFCGFQAGFISGVDASTITISGNAFNPSVQDIIDGNCSQ